MSRPQSALAISRALAGASRADGGKLWAPVLEDVPLFAGVSKRHVRRIAGLAREVRFRPGSAIVKAGEQGDHFFLILDGQASVIRSEGLSPIALGPGAYFGEIALIDGGTRSATVVADTDVLCLRLSRAPFMRTVRSQPEIAVALLRGLAGRLREAQSQTQLMA